MERTAGTFQDRLVTELRLAGGSGIGEANRVLEQFLPRFNRRFGVPQQHPEPAFRPLDTELCLEQVRCFKHSRRVARDNTVRFQLDTLQLLPGPERPSYAGATVEVLEGLDRRLSVRTGGHLLAAPGGALQSGIPPKLPRVFRTCFCPDLRRPRPGRTLYRDPQTTGLKGREREGSRGQQ